MTRLTTSRWLTHSHRQAPVAAKLWGRGRRSSATDAPAFRPRGGAAGARPETAARGGARAWPRTSRLPERDQRGGSAREDHHPGRAAGGRQLDARAAHPTHGRHQLDRARTARDRRSCSPVGGGDLVNEARLSRLARASGTITEPRYARPVPNRQVGAVSSETAALVALLRSGRRPPPHYSALVEEAGSAQVVLEDEHGLLAPELSAAAADELRGWSAQGLHITTVLDRDYPENLRTVHDRPPLIFIAGRLHPEDTRAVAVIGSRRASPDGLERARTLTKALVDSRYTIVSGLAAGIDTAAHMTALEGGGQTVAVIGTGLEHSYPAQNADLQRRIADEGAVVSQFWPEAGPSRQTFPARNAVMSGLSLATVIVEASQTSGARIQARHALGHGRPVLLISSLLDQPWARQLSERPGTHVIASPAEAIAVVNRVASTEAPVA